MKTRISFIWDDENYEVITKVFKDDVLKFSETVKDDILGYQLVKGIIGPKEYMNFIIKKFIKE